ncbi:hypothetical protein CCU68_29640 [Pseudomonas gingeri NCPPB 3146 = LMG 5327]|uniref:Uncharacterized protein n=2 Tax=Pseudomonas gingeri TaxID=117681 RepID=A0A7Y7XZJ6_9PSED|nr:MULTISPECIES: hypothetical protein [Pseudomonas]NVZ27364.1 hypothetical protein [Pseudomonas gingeri]NVZ63848.1 hypothetical protein [Pseudomonas gingeri]NVZ79662.1 hypothetical protein [Pseudomonas gingeri]NWA11844.1 hypothetical protein [Pseudomonas gingeri]NWC15004.1 hypothetical protein [Pseudomonas gingeri]
MRIDGVSSQSYPIKRKPRKAGVVLDGDEELLDNENDDLSEVAARAQAAGSRLANLPARPQDMIFPRSMSKSVATALASYLTTAGFVEWDMEVLGLDLHI